MYSVSIIVYIKYICTLYSVQCKIGMIDNLKTMYMMYELCAWFENHVDIV